MRALKSSKVIAICFIASAMILACTADTADDNTTNTLVTITELSGVGGELFSDVCTTEEDAPFPISCVALNDDAEVTMRAEVKNLLPSLGATHYNNVVIDRYHVTFIRSDGRNTPGVDVPYPFDGAMNLFLELGTGDQSTTFTIVRQQAKLEPPLANLAGNGGAIVFSTIAQVDFYGADTAGRAIKVTGYLNVTFGDF
jgi:hypothetical protein